MRGLGAVMAFAACCALGLMRIAAARRRIDTLAALTEALYVMRGELAARLTAMPMLVEYMAQHSRGDAQSFFDAVRDRLPQLGRRELSELWCESVMETLPALEKDELRELAAAGLVLGRCELEVQLAAIDRCAAALRAAQERAQADYPQQKRLSLGVSAAAGLMLVTLLI